VLKGFSPQRSAETQRTPGKPAKKKFLIDTMPVLTINGVSVFLRVSADLCGEAFAF